MKAVYIYTNKDKRYPVEPYLEIVQERLLELGWKKPKFFYDGFNEGDDGWNDLDVLTKKKKVDGLLLFSLESWASNDRHRFLPVVTKVLQDVKEVHIACAPNLGILKGIKDMPRLEALFNSNEYFSNMSSVAVKAGIARSKKQKGRPPLLQTDRAFVQEVADLYNKGLSIKAIAGRMNSNYNRVYRVIRSLKPEGD